MTDFLSSTISMTVRGITCAVIDNVGNLKKNKKHHICTLVGYSIEYVWLERFLSNKIFKFEHIAGHSSL